MVRVKSDRWGTKSAGIAALGWLYVLAAVAATAGDLWEPARVVRDVEVQARSVPDSPFAKHRGTVTVCTGLDSLASFIADTSRFQEWLPDVEEVRLLERTATTQIHYLRNRTPWPLRSRDMIYQLVWESAEDAEQIRVEVTGLPDYLPEQPGAVRMRSTSGEWILAASKTGVSVSFWLHVDPGSVPAVFANRRLAGSVGDTLANLVERFPCPASDRQGVAARTF